MRVGSTSMCSNPAFARLWRYSDSSLRRTACGSVAGMRTSGAAGGDSLAPPRGRLERGKDAVHDAEGLLDLGGRVDGGDVEPAVRQEVQALLQRPAEERVQKLGVVVERVPVVPELGPLGEVDRERRPEAGDEDR